MWLTLVVRTKLVVESEPPDHRRGRPVHQHGAVHARGHHEQERATSQEHPQAAQLAYESGRCALVATLLLLNQFILNNVK